MSRYRYSSSGFTDYSSDVSFDDDWADEDDLSDEIFDGYVETYVELQVPCTAAEHRTCQIVDHLPAVNNLLSLVGLRLRELSEGDGQLAVVDSRMFLSSWVNRMKQERFRFLAWLLNSHRCVTSLYLNDVSLLKLLKYSCCGLLDGNSSLKSLNEGSRSGITDSDDVCDIIPEVAQLEKLEVLGESLGLGIVEALSEVLRTKSLSALKVFCCRRNRDEEVDAFVSALKASSTLRELSVNAGLFSDSPGRGKIAFMEYLENNTVLEKLNIYGNERDLTKCVLMGMCKNRSVSDLSLFGDCFDFGTHLLLRDLLLENAVLKSFTMSAIDGRHALSHEEGFEEWLEALGKNRGLRYIRFPFAMIPHDQWGSFFETVSTHTSLKEVVVEVSGWKQCEEVQGTHYDKVREFEPYELEDVLHSALLDVCKMLENSGAKHKVTFTFVALQSHPLVEARREPPDFPLPVLPGAMTSPSMDLLKQLCSFDSCRMTELKVELSCLQGHSSGVAQFIKETTTLKKLFLSNRLDYNVPSIDSIRSNILESLSQNTSIIEVTLHAKWQCAESLQHLANVVKSSTTIRALKISIQMPQRFPERAGRLPVDISENYSLCSFSLLAYVEMSTVWTCGWLAWYNTSWRNSGIVARAARFVKRTRCDRRCASALETLSRHPALVAELAEVLTVTDAEAASLVQTRLSHIRDMHEFMRLAGVVKHRVTCEPREDGRKQLRDLNEDCWRHVMRYLKLDDICYPSENVDGTAQQ